MGVHCKPKHCPRRNKVNSSTAQLFANKSRYQACQNPQYGHHLRRDPSCNHLTVACSHLHHKRWGTFLSMGHTPEARDTLEKTSTHPQTPSQDFSPQTRLGSQRASFGMRRPLLLLCAVQTLSRPKTDPGRPQPPPPRPPSRPPSHGDSGSRRSQAAARGHPTPSSNCRRSPPRRAGVPRGGRGRHLPAAGALPTSLAIPRGSGRPRGPRP